ncbi:V-type ATPase 116kDa subunit family protein [uncultured Cellulomonas sp.]|uniref:V-type ATPase 116kDa subunit family protein n=1 Tax=uncultured Cellulomonas sp. TaxID=189682 RepID=UPI00261AA8F2|nr:V-type ATPase 116kDa subunit family protein [uncultured Cellulomonas sp.]
MRWREALHPVGMQRVALLAPRDALRDVLVEVADEGTVAFDPSPAEAAVVPTGATERLQRLAGRPGAEPAVTRDLPDLDAWERAGRADLLAGEAELEDRGRQAVTRGTVAAWLGWVPDVEVTRLAQRVGPEGGAVVPLPRPPGVDPPTLLPTTGVARELAPLVETYATVPYADLNPSVVAGLAYIVMFGLMFADAGHGALLVLAALLVRSRRVHRLERLAPYWRFLAGAGLASTVSGVLYGEFFGPTGVVPVVWLSPLDEPVAAMLAAVGVGAVLLAGAYGLGAVNRYREGGWRLTLYAPSGLAGAALFLGLGAAGSGASFAPGWLVPVGAALAVAGLTATFLGLLAAAGGGLGGAAQAAIESVNLVVRLGSNLVSFARLAAFGLTHAALGAVVWQASAALWGQGPAGTAGAVAVFVVGNALTFALEGVVAAIQALRLEYFELFSRVFDGEGRPFRPWHVALIRST